LSRTALVTGAGGFLGGALARSLAQDGWDVAALERGADLADAVDTLGPPELVFHAAGGASVGASLADPAADRANTVGTLRALLELLQAKAPRARLVYPSSAAVYGDAGPGPISETAALVPVSPYGLHKAEAEALVAGSGLDAVIIRYFSIYGPGLRKQLIWELMNRLAAGPAEVVLGGSGEERRDFLHVDEAVALARLAGELEPRDRPLVLNGGCGEGRTIREVAETLAKAMGSDAAIRFSGQVRAGDPRSLVADMSLARALGFAPHIPLAEGLARLAEGAY